MNEDALKDFIARQLKVQIQGEFLIQRASKTYAGEFKPVSRKYPTPISNSLVSGNLFRSTTVEWVEEDGNPVLQVSFPNAPEWYWVNYGRRGKQQNPSLKYPPLTSILNFIKQKPVRQFKNEDGSIMTQENQAFLIQRSIGEYGYGGINFIQDAFKKVEMKLKKQIGEYAAEYFRNQIKTILIESKTEE